MGSMDAWDVALLAVAAYVAVLALVRLMIRRRDELLEQFRREVKKEKKRKEAEERTQLGKREKAA